MPPAARDHCSARADREAFGEPSKWRCSQEKPPLTPRQSEGRCARTSEDIGDESLVRWQDHGAHTMAPPPDGGRLTTSGLPELLRGNTKLLDLDVQGLVVHPEEPRRLALVPTRGSKR